MAKEGKRYIIGVRLPGVNVDFFSGLLVSPTEVVAVVQDMRLNQIYNARLYDVSDGAEVNESDLLELIAEAH